MLCESRSSPRTLWPSGLRRWLKAPFRKGVGSNPTGVILKILICGLQLLAIACFSDGSIGVSQLWLQRHSFASASLQTSASTGHGMKSMISLGVWRNGSASDSRSEGWEFESLCPQFSFPHGKSIFLHAIEYLFGVHPSHCLLCRSRAQTTPNQCISMLCACVPRLQSHPPFRHLKSTSSSG